jgi:Zn-dependent protease
MSLFQQEEVSGLLIAIIAVAVIFAYSPFNPILTINRLPLSLAVAVVAFLFHELAHKFVAEHFGASAAFKLWPQGILFGLIFMFTGIKFLAPGAVVIYPYRHRRGLYRRVHLDIKEMGIIGASGPTVNILFAALFSLFPGSFAAFLSDINAWLAFFNLLPVNPLDGSRVFTWKPVLWLMLIILSILLFVI